MVIFSLLMFIHNNLKTLIIHNQPSAELSDVSSITVRILSAGLFSTIISSPVPPSLTEYSIGSKLTVISAV